MRSDTLGLSNFRGDTPVLEHRAAPQQPTRPRIALSDSESPQAEIYSMRVAHSPARAILPPARGTCSLHRCLSRYPPTGSVARWHENRARLRPAVAWRSDSLRNKPSQACSCESRRTPVTLRYAPPSPGTTRIAYPETLA